MNNLKWVLDTENFRVITENDEAAVLYLDNPDNKISLEDVAKIIDAHNHLLAIKEATVSLLGAIRDNLLPIAGTTGITVLDEVATGAYVREQYISEELDELNFLLALNP